MRFELYLVVLFSAGWLLAIVLQLGWISIAGLLDLGLYPLYSLASVTGWVSGNVYLHRAKTLALAPSSLRPLLRQQLWLLYLIGPLGLLYLLRAMAPAAAQIGAPLVPIYSFGVFAVFFMVPVSFAVTRRQPYRPRIGDRRRR